MLFRSDDSKRPKAFRKDERRYICYLSLGKVETLYAQTVDYVQSHVKETKSLQIEGKAETGLPSVFGLIKNGLSFGGRRGTEYVIEGDVSPVQRLQRITASFEAQGLIGDLNSSLLANQADSKSICFSYSGVFTCVGREESTKFTSAHKDYIRKEEQETAYSPLMYGVRTIGRMCVLKSEFAGYTLFLACSTKYFSDMGSSRIEGKDGGEDVFAITPHSGNHFFFAGEYPATFDVILFLTGQRERNLYGSPIALINTFTPDLTI